MKIKFEIIEFNKNIDDIYLTPAIVVAGADGKFKKIIGIGVKFLKFIIGVSLTINREIKC